MGVRQNQRGEKLRSEIGQKEFVYSFATALQSPPRASSLQSCRRMSPCPTSWPSQHAPHSFHGDYATPIAIATATAAVPRDREVS